MFIRNFLLSVPLLYLLRQSGEPWSLWGIVPFQWRRDLGCAVLIMFASNFATNIFTLLVDGLFDGKIWSMILDDANKITKMQTWFSATIELKFWPLLIAGHASNAFVEELSMRGYLIPRLEQIFGSSRISVMLSSLIFASYHVYQGALGALGLFVWGIVMGIAYCRLRRLWPLVITHALVNVILSLWPS